MDSDAESSTTAHVCSSDNQSHAESCPDVTRDAANDGKDEPRDLDSNRVCCGSNKAHQQPLSSGCGDGTPSLTADLVHPEHPGWGLWRGPLRGARLVVAPMVDASELAWRMLSRRYGAELCYTPMLHSAVLVRDARYRRDSLQSCHGDRPLVVQVCGNDPETLGEACALVSPHCDAVDINFGCPQAIARKGRYGAFLMEDWPLVRRLVESAVRCSHVPVTCKIRVFSDVQKTVQYARLLQEAGAALLTVHGRTRDQKGPLTGLANWAHIAAVRKAVDVPMFANGNIQYRGDVERCLQATGTQGVMSAEGNLYNPAIFADPTDFPESAPTVWRMALEYLQLAEQYPCPISYSRGHIFKLLHHCFSMAENSDIRQTVSRCTSVSEMKEAVQLLQERMTPYVTGEKEWVPENEYLSGLPLRPWLCQPYVRLSPDEHTRRCEQGQLKAQLRQQQGALVEGVKKRLLDVDEDDEKEADLLLKFEEGVATLSKKKAKKLLRNPRKKFLGSNSENLNLCVCRSPRGGKCEHALCKACCRSRCYRDNLDCAGHRVWVKTSRHKASTLPPKNIHTRLEVVHGSIRERESENENRSEGQNLLQKSNEGNYLKIQSVEDAASLISGTACEDKNENESSELVFKNAVCSQL